MGAGSGAASWTKLAQNVPLSNTPGAFPRRLIADHESVLFETRPSLWGRYWPGLVFFGFFFFTVIGGSFLDGAVVEGVALSFIFFGLPIVVLVLAWWRTVYALTDTRILRVSGLLSRTFQTASYDEIQNLSVGSGSSGNITFDTGTGRRGLIMRAPGQGQRIVWSSVPYAGQVYEYVQTAFAVHAAESQEASIRKALIARAMGNTLTCEYCRTLIDVRSIEGGRAKCPSCGAPVLAP